ncbi:hypothetical protein O3P69_008894 [Scylla paramamosain]|uniref:Secreted protein n=1 Tax=Scylla paramamosain TaxID=85552 RepID=A0AAW0TT54_SCYPA
MLISVEESFVMVWFGFLLASEGRAVTGENSESVGVRRFYRDLQESGTVRPPARVHPVVGIRVVLVQVECVCTFTIPWYPERENIKYRSL